MAKPDERAREREAQTQSSWGTWEDLLLACAVQRYGTDCWDSVAQEIRKRSSAALHLLVTPIHCEQRYNDLRRRYTPQKNAGDADDKAETDVPWLEELRKVRVAELRRELERYDLSIAALQLKVKKLKEEHGQSLREDDGGGEKSDLEKIKEMRGGGDELDRSPDGKPCGYKLDQGNQSVNESNSTDSTIDKLQNGRKDDDKGEDNSCNRSSETVEKEQVLLSMKVETEGILSDSPELTESMDESKDGGGAGGADGSGGEGSTDTSNSDEQSSASKSKKEAPNKVHPDYEPEDQSPAVEGISVKSKTLLDFLEIIRSHKLGSIFERRLKSQETLQYRSLIRQHMDLEIIRARLEEGWYAGSNRRFFRDLLLVINNAMVFFYKNSTECAAAIELLQLILKEMSRRFASAEQNPLNPSNKQELGQCDSLLPKPKLPGPIVVCQKRSSITAKATVSSSGADVKRDQTVKSLKGKPTLPRKQPGKPYVNTEEQQTKKKRTKDGFTSTASSSKKNDKNGSNIKPNKSSEANTSQPRQGKGLSLGKQPDPKNEKNNTSTRKQNAAIIFNPTKRNLSTDDGSLLDRLKNLSSNSDNNRPGAEQKRSRYGKGNMMKCQASERGSGGRKAKPQESLAKKTIGRPQKQVAPPSTLSTLSGKRGREGGDTEAVASRQPKKRPRK